MLRDVLAEELTILGSSDRRADLFGIAQRLLFRFAGFCGAMQGEQCRRAGASLAVDVHRRGKRF